MKKVLSTTIALALGCNLLMTTSTQAETPSQGSDVKDAQTVVNVTHSPEVMTFLEGTLSDAITYLKELIPQLESIAVTESDTQYVQLAQELLTGLQECESGQAVSSLVEWSTFIKEFDKTTKQQFQDERFLSDLSTSDRERLDAFATALTIRLQ